MTCDAAQPLAERHGDAAVAADVEPEPDAVVSERAERLRAVADDAPGGAGLRRPARPQTADEAPERAGVEAQPAPTR